MTTINKTRTKMRNDAPTPIDAISNIASLELSEFVPWSMCESEVVLGSVLSVGGWEVVTSTSDGSEVVIGSVLSEVGRVIVSGMSVGGGGSEKADVGSVVSEGGD